MKPARPGCAANPCWRIRAACAHRGYLLDINFDYVLTDRCTMTAFFFMASGDGNPRKGAFTAFYGY